MSRIPTDPKKIRARIALYERNLKERDYRDGSGSRFLLGPFYMMLGDLDGALAHYKWFDKKFPDSSDEPFHVLSRCQALHRAGDESAAAAAAIRVYLANPYLIPHVLGISHGQPEVRRGSNWKDEEYIFEAPPELFHAWTEQDRTWLTGVWKGAPFLSMVKRHIEIELELQNEPPGPRRTALVHELHSLGRVRLTLVKPENQN